MQSTVVSSLQPAAARRSPPAIVHSNSLDRLLVLDIETVPDTDLVDPGAEGFPKIIHHRIVCISFVEARIETNPDTGSEAWLVEQVRSGGEPGWNEERLLRGFWRHFEGGRYRAVSWNGRAFDVPVIQMRSLVYGIAAPAWFRRGTKWEGYENRYAGWHADVMEQASGFGASTRLGLDTVAKAIGLPGKGGEHGSNVAELVGRGEIERVRNYCEGDVLNTFAIAVRHAFLTGRSDAADHDRSIDALVAYLAAERVHRPHLGAFLDRWRDSARPRPMHVGPGSVLPSRPVGVADVS